ncbi:hypothetical protein Ocin01_12442 [Orchesella cincta]|uniref:Transmembrane protein n=1 Tax=Orchesella cincta TaxID=48709 RepID=A0A1D2MMF6_ORCCI|nr:hypothetical protein Ocin01_12442 [Orchesella cincta]
MSSSSSSMLPNPCPCMTLQCGVKVVAAIDAACHAYATAATILVLAILDHIINEAGAGDNIVKSWTLVKVVYCLFIVGRIIGLVMAIVLYFGAQNNKACMGWTWIGSKALLMIPSSISLGSKKTHFKLDVSVSYLSLCWLGVGIYFIYVVFAFIQELRRQGQQQECDEMRDSATATVAPAPFPPQFQLQPSPLTSTDNNDNYGTVPSKPQPSFSPV